MIDNLAKPGNIIIKTMGDFPVYGIILPKGKFLEYFENEKGKWPEGEKFDDKAEEFGYELPLSRNTPQKILSKGSFLRDKGLIGAKLFGEVNSKSLRRKLSFEVFNSRDLAGNFKPQDLSVINKIRSFCGYEFGTPSSMNPSFTELKWLQNYFSGEYHNIPTEEVEYSLSCGEKGLIDLLRDCEIPENILE